MAIAGLRVPGFYNLYPDPARAPEPVDTSCMDSIQPFPKNFYLVLAENVPSLFNFPNSSNNEDLDR